MRDMRHRSFLELSWSIFRFCMKCIFAVLSVFYLVGTLVVCLVSPEFSSMPPHQFLASVGGALLFGMVFVSYVTLLLAVPVSAFCAVAAFCVTGVTRLYEHAFADLRGGIHYPEPALDPEGMAAVEVVESRVDAKAADCPVCASPLDSSAELVSCMRCDGLHHPDCWSYFGSCATFGCGSERARPSTQPAPAAAPEWPAQKPAPALPVEGKPN
jgi:hypothetical protein